LNLSNWRELGASEAFSRVLSPTLVNLNSGSGKVKILRDKFSVRTPQNLKKMKNLKNSKKFKKIQKIEKNQKI